MKDLRITVNNKIATYHKRDGDIVCGNNDYQIVFTFDAEWDAHVTKTARFIWKDNYTDVVFTGNICPVPIITNAASCEVGVYAGNLATTTPAIIGCVKSILCGDGLPASPNDDVYAQIMQIIDQLGTTVTTQIIPVFVLDDSSTLAYGVKDLDLYAILGYRRPDGSGDEEREFGRVTDTTPYLPCYTSAHFYTDMHIYPQSDYLDVAYVMLYHKDGSVETKEVRAYDDAYIALDTDIEYIIIECRY